MNKIPAAEIQYEEARINQSKSTANIIVLSVFTGVASLVLCARLASRKIQNAGFAFDDYLIVVGMVSSYDLCPSDGKMFDTLDAARLSRLSTW